MDDKALQAAFDDGLEVELRKLARTHTSDAIGTLATLMKGKKVPPNVKRQSAMDLLAQGWGKPDAREDTGGQKTGAGLTIVIQRLYDGGKTTIDVDVSEAKRIAETIDALPKDIPQ